MAKYFGQFHDFADMLSEWGDITKGEIVPDSDDDVLFASYGTESYEGYATVIFRKDNKLYEVSGCHCSCYGLSEDSISGGNSQWHAEETSCEALSKRDPYLNLDDDKDAIDAYAELMKQLMG